MTTWSPQQDSALKAVGHWLKNDAKQKQVFRLFGVAGTGKTTLAKHLAASANGQVNFAAFTGKAAHVLRSKGCGEVSTIHKLIYTPKAKSNYTLKKLEAELVTAQKRQAKELVTQLQGKIKAEQELVGNVRFELNPDSELKRAKLLILDECSMVDKRLAKDLESFNVPILVLGDPEQLPPVYGQGHYTEHTPDIMLTEIHRQAQDNPIIRLSQLVREGQTLTPGVYGGSQVLTKAPDPEQVLKHDIILTGLRRTKRACDLRCRELLGHESKLPVVGDKLICVKNRSELGLLNGQLLEVSDVVSRQLDTGKTTPLWVTDPETNERMFLQTATKLFVGEPLQKWEHDEEVQELEYAYALTVHKAQGSQWQRVLLFDEKHKFPTWTTRDRQRWLYTGITRAADSVTVVTSG